MALEIERKYLIKNNEWKSESLRFSVIKQGYLSTDINSVVRVRTLDKKAFLTIKGITKGISRAEFEYEIPFSDAIALLQLCSTPVIEKTRYFLPQENHTWEIDVFEGKNKGLIIAEIELTSEEEIVDLPAWIGKDVSHDERYFNAYLVQHPFTQW